MPHLLFWVLDLAIHPIIVSTVVWVVVGICNIKLQWRGNVYFPLYLNYLPLASLCPQISAILAVFVFVCILHSYCSSSRRLPRSPLWVCLCHPRFSPTRWRWGRGLPVLPDGKVSVWPQVLLCSQVCSPYLLKQIYQTDVGGLSSWDGLFMCTSVIFGNSLNRCWMILLRNVRINP